MLQSNNNIYKNNTLPKITRLYWSRHSESVANTHEYLHSLCIDPELTNNGKKCSLQFANKLITKNIHIDYIICSPLKRSIETGKIIKNAFSINRLNSPKIHVIPYIKEQGFGLDNIPTRHEYYSYTKLKTKLMAFTPFSQYNEFIKSLKNYEGLSILIIGHKNTNIDYIQRLTNIKLDRFNNNECYRIIFENMNFKTIQNLDNISFSNTNYIRD